MDVVYTCCGRNIKEFGFQNLSPVHIFHQKQRTPDKKNKTYTDHERSNFDEDLIFPR